jgi:hypothetical protein
MKAQDKTRTTATKMKFTRTAKCTWIAYKRNKDMLKEI